MGEVGFFELKILPPSIDLCCGNTNILKVDPNGDITDSNFNSSDQISRYLKKHIPTQQQAGYCAQQDMVFTEVDIISSRYYLSTYFQI